MSSCRVKSWTLLLIMLAATASAQGVVQVASTGDDQSLKRLSIEELSRVDVT